MNDMSYHRQDVDWDDEREPIERKQFMNLETLQEEVKVWHDKNFPNTLPHQPLLGIQEEVGELSHAHLKMEQGIRGTEADHIRAKMDAVGDIVVFLADYCSQNDLDFAHCVSDTWSKVKNRDWTKDKLNGGQ
jgi:hypothetical protein